MTSCYTSKLTKNEYLLEKNTIEVNSKKVNKDELFAIIKQRPNKKILGILKIHLLLHNIPDSARVEEKRLKKLNKKNRRIAKKNIKRLKNQKDTLLHKQLVDISTFGYKLLYSIGESPVIYDTISSVKTSKQLHLFLIRKGFFNNSVKDSVVYFKKRLFGIKKRRARVFYKVRVKEPFRIKQYELQSKDSSVLSFVKTINKESVIKVGDIFDVDNMNKERNRITDFLLNNGYYKFNKKYIDFYIDSSVGENEVNIKANISLAKNKIQGKDSVYTSKHDVYIVKKVYYNYTQNEFSSDTLKYSFKGVEFLIIGKNDIRASVFYRSLYLKPCDLFSKDKEQQTFRSLTSLGLFKIINIKSQVDANDENALNLFINITENKKQETRIDGNGTNSGSSFGVEGSTSYSHKNFFRGAETFRVTIRGKLESQPLLVDDNTSDNTNLPVNINSFANISNTFNTVEFGPELLLTIPKLLFVNPKSYKKIHHANTQIKASLNYQRRINVNVLDYERGIQEVSFGYSWKVKDKVSHFLDPISFSAIEVNKSQEFQDRINLVNDRLLAASFQNHIISATRYRFVYNELNIKTKKRNVFYYSGNIESAGNILRTSFDISSKEADSTGSYSVLGIQFAQYLKTSHDVRVYKIINEKNSFVFRLQSGLGVPLSNSRAALPFEKSFFSGGTDKIRAWKARSLGPGSFRDTTLSFDKIGEILIEGNLEYRFDVLGFVDGALFVDAGNIWLMNQDSLRPGSNFEFNRFLGEIAIGAGFGLRIDLSFFLLRFDLGFPIKNPSLIKGERWFFQPKNEYQSHLNSLSNPERAPSLYQPQFNIGIGFPF